MREGYCSRSVCYQASCSIHYFCIESKIPLGFSWWFYQMKCGIRWKHFVQKLWQHLLIISTFASWWTPDVQRDSDGFFSTRVECKSSDTSFKSTDSSLVAVDCQLSFLACCSEMLSLHAWHGRSRMCMCVAAFMYENCVLAHTFALPILYYTWHV